jgi:hypothetical protein
MQTAAVLYLDNTVVVDTGDPPDVRKLNNTFATSGVTTSVNNSTQATSAERTFDPQSATGVTNNAQTTHNDRGWAIPPADMTPADAAHAPFIAAQTLTVNINATATGTGTGAVGANDVYTPKASLWKYDPSTDTASLIIGGAGSASSFSAAVAYGPTAFTTSVSLSVPAATFASNEIMMIVIGGTLACGGGLAGGARTFTVRLLHSANTTNLTFATQGLREMGEMTGSAAGVAAATAEVGTVLPLTGTAAGVGAATAVLAGVGATTGAAAAAAVTEGLTGSVSGTTGTAAGTASTAGEVVVVVGTVGTSAISGGGGATVVRRPIYVFDD